MLQVVDVLASAIEYNLDGLAKCCVQFITNGLKIDSACEAIQVDETVSLALCKLYTNMQAVCTPNSPVTFLRTSDQRMGCHSLS